MEIQQTINQNIEETDAYSLFLYAFRSPITKDCYLRRMTTFFNFIKLLPNGNLEQQCNLFALKGLEEHRLPLRSEMGILHCLIFRFSIEAINFFSLLNLKFRYIESTSIAD